MAERPPVMLLHPFPLDAAFWDPVARALRADRPVIVPEFPGLGAAPPEDEPTIEGFADALAERIARELPAGRAVVCGVSMGGYAALALAARHPERVAALVLVDTRAEPDTPEAREGREAIAARVRADGPAAFLDEFMPTTVARGDTAALAAVRRIADRQEREAIARTLHALGARGDRRPDLPRMAMPALVVVGAEDAITPVSCARELAAGLPDAELVVIAGAGHFAAVERPQEFLAAFRGFLARRVDAHNRRARRGEPQSQTRPELSQGIVPIVPYPDPRAAIAWLERAFGARATAVYPPEPDRPLEHAEVQVGEGLVMLSDTRQQDENPFALPGPLAVYVVVDDPDARYERAVAAGAEIVRGLTDQDYGSRDFAARDPAGNVWSFGTYRPSIPD